MEKTVSQAKPARAKKPSAQEQAKATIAKMKQTALPLPSPTTAPGELAMVPIELIDTTNQVRTVFFEDSIKELAGKHLFVSALGHAGQYNELDCVAGHMAASGADFDLERLINLAITAARMAAQVE